MFDVCFAMFDLSMLWHWRVSRIFVKLGAAKRLWIRRWPRLEQQIEGLTAGLAEGQRTDWIGWSRATKGTGSSV